MKRSLAFAAALLGLGLGARSTLADVDCNSDSLTQLDMNECTDKDYQAAQAKLDAVIEKLKADLKTEYKPKDFEKAFEKSEKSWEKHRDDDCAFQGFINGGGSIYGMVVEGCQTTLTDARTAELQSFLDDLTSE
jgi:uncharacterized protein YecT (DUF1311 family)